MPFIPENLITPEQAIYQAVLEEMQSFRNEWRADMANLNESLDTLAGDIQTQLQQVRDALGKAQGALDDKAAVEQALADAQAVIDSADQRVQSFSADLKSDDPQPEPPADGAA